MGVLIRVLIIEDEDRLRHMMRLALEPDYEVGEAGSGESGLEQFGSGHDWDVVLLDQRLPGVDGLETLRRLRQRDPAACVVMITAFASIELAVDAMKLGATDFLRKPVSPESLRGALAAALHGKTGRMTTSPPVGGEKPGIVHMTLNGFHIVRDTDTPTDPSGSPFEHHYTVLQFANGARHHVIVRLDPDEVARVSRLSRRTLAPQGAFWSGQAERFLATALWMNGSVPEGGSLIVTDLPLETIDVAAAWDSD